MNKKVQLICISLISFLLGIFSVRFFDKNSVKESFRSINFSNHENRISSSASAIKESQQIIASSAKNDSFHENEEEIDFGKNVNYITLSSQMNSFQDKAYEILKKKFVVITSAQELQDKDNAERKYILESNLNEMLAEKKFRFKASIKGTKSDERIVLYSSFYSCKANFDTAVTTNSLADMCNTTNFYSFANNNWLVAGMGGSIGYWIGDQPYTMLYTEYMADYLKNTNTMRLFIPLPIKGGQMLSLKYKPGKFYWEAFGEIDWEPVTEKEARNFDKYVQKYNRDHRSSEDQ